MIPVIHPASGCHGLQALALAAVVALGSLLSAGEASAYSEFQRAFQKKYARAKGVDRDFRKAIMKAKCHVCHFDKNEETDEHPCNPYGLAMAEHVGEADKKDKAKIVAALEAVAEQSSNPSDPDAPTYGELLAADRLPYEAAE